VAPGLPYLMGEMLHAVERELACTLGDLLVRRTRIAFETTDHGWSAAPAVAEAVGPVLGWSAGQTKAELGALRGEIERTFGIET
jgi:glycerol-3-phosphate dehydrogenase